MSLWQQPCILIENQQVQVQLCTAAKDYIVLLHSVLSLLRSVITMAYNQHYKFQVQETEDITWS